MVGCAESAEIVPIPDTVYDFSLTDTLNNKVQLTDLTNTNDGVVIVFFRGHFWGICRQQLVELEGIYNEFKKYNAELVAISMDSREDTLSLIRELGLSYHVLPDPTGKVVKKYDVYNLLGDGVATPSVFIVSGEKSVNWKYIGESISDRPDNETLLSQIRKTSAK